MIEPDKVSSRGQIKLFNHLLRIINYEKTYGLVQPVFGFK